MKALLESHVPSSFSPESSSPSCFAWPYGPCLVHVHLNIQTNTWDDPYTDFWNSVFEHLSPPWYSCFSNCIYFQSSSLSSTQQNHCALLEFSFFVMSVHKEPPGRKLGHLRTQFICFLFPRNRVPYSLFNFWQLLYIYIYIYIYMLLFLYFFYNRRSSLVLVTPSMHNYLC